MALRRARHNDRRGQSSRLVILGLANPGKDFEGSRHNVGGDAVRLVVQRRGGQLVLERHQRALTATLPTPEGPVTLAVPTVFMNESGSVLAPLMRRTSLESPSHLVVVHDELDLEPGRVQIKFGGGLAGHNGLRSIAQALDSQDFARVRVGIGKPPSKEQGANYVLKRPTGKLKEALRADVALAADAIEALLDYSFDVAQQRVNAS
ncbi:MAG TPA: aminoacyl-tRNA hydrolase [Acidimicrobiales bacterium]|nr:aminoacyl-tRNA hydrolase [Acidimicrobiales bacterium]